MKKILVAVLLTASFGAAAWEVACYWTKISEQTGMNGLKICQWKCGYGSDARYTTTSGYGYCPTP